MKRDLHINQLEETDYQFALNSSTEEESGEYLNLTNEPSNYLAVNFPTNYKVIGRKKFMQAEKTFYFLTNPFTKKSSIGYVEDNLIESTNNDPYSGEENVLETPLENTIQTPTHTYVELINDLCLEEGEGLNFDINFSIKFISIKVEKGQVNLYWNDYNNPPRWMNTTDVSYLFTQEIPCEEDVVTNCLIVDKLLQKPKYGNIILEPETLQTGGNLKMGTYEFYPAYCDVFGNNISDYGTPTNPIPVFDENNNILAQTDLDAYTNFAIKLKVKGLDNRHPYYKIVCVERNNVTNTQSAFLEGIHPTTDDTVLYTSSGSADDEGTITSGNKKISKRVPLSQLFEVTTKYEKIKGTAAINGQQFQWGLYRKPELNLQPVVNLFGSLMKWQTSIAKEDIYKNAIAASKYKGFRRNEVQPFAFRFLFKDGGYTANFPIISRPEFEGDRDIIDPLNPIRASVEANAPDCSTTEREQKWQFLNTAVPLGICKAGGNIPTQEVQDTISRTCTVDAPVEILNTPGEALIDINPNYVDLKTYIEDGNFVNQEIQDALDATYPEAICKDSLPCDAPTNVTATNNIGIREVISEESTLIESCIENYAPTLPPQFCELYKKETLPTGVQNIIKDEVFAENFMPCATAPNIDNNCLPIVYKRDFNANNEICNYASDVLNNNDPSQSFQAYFHNYYGGNSLADVLYNGGSKTATTAAGFENQLHKGALFFKINKNSRDKIIFEITKKSDCTDPDEVATGTQMRYSFYSDCNSTQPLPIAIDDFSSQILIDQCGAYTAPTPGIINADEGLLVQLDVTGYPEEFYVAIDSPITQIEVPLDREAGGSCVCVQDTPPTVKYRTEPICGCFGIYTRDVEYNKALITWDSITFEKSQTYTGDCTFEIPLVGDCDPVPYAYGEFAFNESTETYPDNEELYNSSKLNISEEDLLILSQEDRTRFENFYTRATIEGDYVLKEDTNFACSNIRHPKFPDNILAPFMNTNTLAPFSEAFVYPMGVSIDNNVVKAMLDIALKNNLISKKDYDNIEGFEILRGDNSVSKSVLASGLVYDMYEYTKKDNKYLYSNYPHNDLGEDLLHYTDKNRNQLISHPYNSDKNNRFSFLSPDIFLTKPALPTEMVVSGYQLGSSSGRFVDVEKHPKWTILGKDSRTTADILAGAEVFLEAAIKFADLLSQQWQVFGLANGFSLGLSGAIATGVAFGAQGFLKYGQYRYQWLEIFRNLGPMDNFAGYNVSKGHHNRFVPNTIDFNNDNSVGANEYLRGLSLKKYMKDGRYEYRDNTSTDNKLLVNNWGREESVFLSTGDYPIHYTTDYKNYDNNKISPEQGSRTTMSQNDCTIDIDYERNVGSPYVTLKNYIPDQYGTIDSIKWLTTNNKFKLDESTDCKPMFGGTVYISRFTWKRKLPLFTTTAMGEPNKLAFNYRQYKNIAEPKFYCDYENGSVTNFLGFIPAPDIDSDYSFDCLEGSREFYVKPPSKMYLYYYGITDFLVESEINCNFRYGRNRLEDNFYPQVGDIVRWTQEINVPISEPNTIYYNNTYSLPVSNTPYKRLDTTFSKERQLILAKQNNAVIWSEKDVDENSPVDPWLINRPLNWFEFKSDNGDLIELKQIEGGQVLARFEDKQLILNAVDNLADRMLAQTQDLGTGGIFSTRPAESNSSDLGFSGSQHHQTLSTPYGHITVDAKRGKIHLTTTQGSEVISESVGGQPTYMKNWFRENLPFKILKYYPNTDVDNNYKGIGITMGWDARFDRAFITKKDIVPIKEVLQACNGFYNPNLSDYIGTIQNYENNEFVFEGIEDCSLKFVKAGIPSTTDVYAFFDTTSMLVQDGVDAAAALNSWFSEYQTLNPEYQGNLYIIPFSSETWVRYPYNVATGNISVTGGAWTSIAILPPNLNTPNWVPPTDLVVLAFVDETDDQYHATFLSDGFSTGVVQPTNQYIADFNTHVGIVNTFDYFKGILYPIPRDTTTRGAALVLQGLAAIEGSLLTPQQIINTGTTIDVSLLLTENPYIPIGALKDYGWSGVWDKLSPASSVFNSETFSEELNALILDSEEGLVELVQLDEIELTNTEYFEDASWTIAFKIGEGWTSYYSFKPNYYSFHNEFFQVGYNYGDFAETMWSHTLSNKSLQVFQGRREPWIIEVPFKNQNVNKILKNLTINLESKRYQNKWDYSQHKDVGFNKLTVFNNTNNSGELNLIQQKSYKDTNKYPITNSDNTQDVLYIAENNNHHVNYFYNRVINQDNNVPQWLWRKNRIEKTVNPLAVSFIGKRLLERMKGQQFIVRLTQDKESRYSITLKSVINKEIIEN